MHRKLTYAYAVHIWLLLKTELCGRYATIGQHQLAQPAFLPKKNYPRTHHAHMLFFVILYAFEHWYTWIIIIMIRIWYHRHVQWRVISERSYQILSQPQFSTKSKSAVFFPRWYSRLLCVFPLLLCFTSYLPVSDATDAPYCCGCCDDTPFILQTAYHHRTTTIYDTLICGSYVKQAWF